MVADDSLAGFIKRFNADLDALGCGARVRAIDSRIDEMAIVDLDGGAIGRIPIEIEPRVFTAFMRIVEASYEEGVASARERGGEGSARAEH